VALPSGADGWLRYALAVVPAFVASRGAVIWPEVEANLRETSWITENFDLDFPPRWGIDPHILHRAQGVLEQDGAIREERVELNKRVVSAWLDVPGLATRRTEIERIAASKRRLYRSYLTWAGNADLCGRVAEELVLASLDSLRGSHVWLPDDIRAGQVTSLLGRPLQVGGPLDAAGFLAIDPANPTSGFVPFAVEVKNVRSMIYPWHREAWDLLAKLAAFPDVLPILVSRRIHNVTFKCFKDIGAIGLQTMSQWFHNRATARASIDANAFEEVKARFSFYDATLVDSPRDPQRVVTHFFSETLRIGTARGPLAAAQLDRWRLVAPIVAQFTELRAEHLPDAERRELWRGFCTSIQDAGFYERGEWAPNGTDVEP
jgi:hypothetical protein